MEREEDTDLSPRESWAKSFEEIECRWNPSSAAQGLDPRETWLGLILCAGASVPSPGCCCPLLVSTGIAHLAEQRQGSWGLSGCLLRRLDSFSS